MNRRIMAGFVLVLVVGLLEGYGAGTALSGTHTVTQLVTVTETSTVGVQAVPAVVNLDVVPDLGGAGYDAFVIPSHVDGTLPRAGTNSTPPGPNDNNVTVPAGVAVRFVITNLDTAVNMNFTGAASTDFTIYNDTNSGYVALHYSKGQALQKLPVGHTFSIPTLNVSIPIPPDTVVTFTYTFTTPGIYQYMCEAPCDLGMGLAGYMVGYVTVTP
ncbi:MAG TPA: hypothetical protein VLV31_04075 [Candidatus Acidoferrales bacterium]|nr:hypothetical protein [Candidatus Acidoferrales bacterium]